MANSDGRRTASKVTRLLSAPDVPMTWAIVTGEYPPQPGGVSGYTWVVANALAATGDRVHVFAPPTALPERPSDVHVHRLSDTFGARGRRELYAALDALPTPRRVLVQFVLQSFGMRAVNLPFVRSLQRLRGYPLWMMFHEFALDDNPSEDPARRAQAYFTRVLARMAARTADLAFVSIPAWGVPIAEAAPACPIRWLPIPSNVATSADPAEVARIGKRYRPPGGTLAGHFGTYRMRDSQQFLREAVPLIARGATARRVLLLGRGSDAFAAAIVAADPSLAGRVLGTGDLESSELANHLAACDALIQPYSDGVTTRRGSLLAGLALGVPIVTTLGPLTEDFWVPSGAVLFAAPNDVAGTLRELERLLADDALRRTTAERARELYARRFDVSLTVAALRGG
jgi:glycosyltransferase involved in cell wall biosynthesis